MGPVGLRTHIWSNAFRSLLLLAAFPLLVLAITYAFAILTVAGGAGGVGEGLEAALGRLPELVPVAVVVTLVWYAIAYLANQWIIDLATGAGRVERAAEPRVYNLLENLSISRGLPTPTLRIIETPALNAFASGIRRSKASVTVTRGLLDNLDDEELEGVLAHELTHVLNGDVRLLVIATVFVGIVSLVGDLLTRSFGFGAERSYGGGWSGGWRPRSSSEGSSRRGSAGAMIALIAIAVAIFLVARLLALVVRFALSRRREFMADAGAVELTKDPDAMIRALRKIEGHAETGVASPEIREMFFENPRMSGLAGLFATHPPIAARVEALVRFAGGHDPGPIALPAPPAAGENAGDGAAPPAVGEEAAAAPESGPPEAQEPRPRGPWDPPPA